MTAAISLAAKHGAKAVICASTGNTSASRRGLRHQGRDDLRACSSPTARSRWASSARPSPTAPPCCRSTATSTTASRLARKLAEAYPVELVNSVNPARIEGQKTASFEVVDALGDAPDIHCLPVGNAGNITAYWKGYREYHARPSEQPAARRPGCPRCGASRRRARLRSCSGTPSTTPTPSPRRSASATPPRGSRPRRPATSPAAGSRRSPTSRSWPRTGCSRAARGSSSSRVRRPASPACCRPPRQGTCRPGPPIVCTVTGHGLKDPQWALRNADGSDVTPTRVPVDAFTAAQALGLDG